MQNERMKPDSAELDKIAHIKPELLQRQIIGCMLARGGKHCVTQFLELGGGADWFTDHRCSETWEAIRSLYLAGAPVIDLTTVWHRLLDSGSRLATGNESVWLDQCVDAVETTQYLPWYVTQYRPHHQRCAMAASLGVAKDTVLSDTIEAGHKAIQSTMAEANELLTAATPTESMDAAVDALLAGFRIPPRDRHWVPWPVAELDTLIGRISHELIYVAARPSLGKTAFLVQLMLRAARIGIPTSLKTLESPREQILSRMMACEGNMDMTRIRSGEGSADDLQIVESIGERLKAMGDMIHICDKPASASELSAWAQTQAASGSRLLAIDNLKHIRPNMTLKSTVEQFREFSRAIKFIRDDVRLPVLVIHHLSRDGQLSWSDDMERDADIVLHLTLDEEQSAAVNARLACVVNLEVRKNRDGAGGVGLSMHFDKIRQTFSELDDGTRGF